MRRSSATPLALLAALPLASQAPPATDIWLADLTIREGRITIARPGNVTDRPGYDNQPAFLPDGTAFYYTAIGDDGQADVWRYDLAAGRAVRVTATPESEYSPTPLPGAAGFSVVRVERDSTQRLWRFAPDGAMPTLLVPDLPGVGYHAWADPGTLAAFVLGSPPALVVVALGTGRRDTLALGIGRALQTVPGRRTVSFAWRADSTTFWLAEADPVTRSATRLVLLPPGAEFHAWAPGGIALASAGTRIYQWDRTRPGGWIEAADLASAGVAAVTRLAVSPDGTRLAVVGVPAQR
jgi:hypothetical protein